MRFLLDLLHVFWSRSFSAWSDPIPSDEMCWQIQLPPVNESIGYTTALQWLLVLETEAI